VLLRFRTLLGLGLATGVLSGSAGATPLEHDEQKYSEWQSDEHSFYASSASDAGIVYARPQLTLGYGSPFWSFSGFDGYLLSTNGFAAAYAGWRASLPFLDVQFGRRWNYPFNRRYLPKKDVYRARDLDLNGSDSRATYAVTEGELTLLAPLFHGAAFVEAHPMWFDAPDGKFVFEEVMRVVIVPPFAMRTRLGFVYGFDERQNVKVGAMVEYLVTPGRPFNTTRVGPLALVSFRKDFEGLFTTTVVVSGPDDLGPYAGTYGFLGVRYRWAKRF
jgi:hypothetical protein